MRPALLMRNLQAHNGAGVDSLQSQIGTLVRRLQSLHDLALRGHYLRHKLLNMPTATVAELLMLVVSGAEARDRDHILLLQCLSLALADRSCEELRHEVARLLAASDQCHLAQLLCGDEGAGEQATTAQPQVDFGLGRPVTLGERKSLARRRDRDLLARVLRDPHPDVIEIVLNNPTLTEADVLRLCARRPVQAEVLRRVFCSARWVAQYPVKVALALNPHCPLDVRMQLALLLSRQDVVRLMQSGDLPAALAESCRRLVGAPTVH